MKGRARHVGFAVDAEDRDELVASLPADQVAAAHRAAQPARHFLEHLVAGSVAVGVVDRLEAVQVEKQHGGLAIVAPGRAEQMQAELIDQSAVRQAGERVVPRCMQEKNNNQQQQQKNKQKKTDTKKHNKNDGT